MMKPKQKERESREPSLLIGVSAPIFCFSVPLLFSIMHFKLLFSLSIYSITIIALLQAENDVQPWSTNQVDSSNLEPTPLDNIANYNVDTENSFFTSDPNNDLASQDSPILIDETANERVQPDDLASDYVVSQNPGCQPNLSTRDEMDDSILGCFPCST